MPLIAFASTKGGAGKTSGCLAVAADLALDGHSVEILDADPNQHAARIGAKIGRRIGDKLRVVGKITEENILNEIKAARQTARWVLLDLPGVSSKLTLLGMSRADLVIVPCQSSEMDITDALVTVRHVKQAGDAVEREIPVRALLTRWPVTVETRVGRETRKRLAKARVEILPTPLMERVAIKELTFAGYVPRLTDPGGNAAANISKIAADITEVLS
jgi:chromosome partitioning protein